MPTKGGGGLIGQGGTAPRGRSSGTGPKPLRAASVKSPRGERRRKGRDIIPSGGCRRGERERTGDQVSKAYRRCRNREVFVGPGRVWGAPWLPPRWHPACR